MSKHTQLKRALACSSWSEAEDVYRSHPEFSMKVDSQGRSLIGYAFEDGRWAQGRWLLDRGWPAAAALDGMLRSCLEAPGDLALDAWRACEKLSLMPAICGKSILEAAVAHKSMFWLEKIIAKGWACSPESMGGAWRAAMAHFKPEVCSMLLKAISLPKGAAGLSDLAVEAFRGGRFEAVRWLVERGLDVSALGSNGESLLVMACAARRGDVAKWLLDRGAIVDQLDLGSGRTALGQAVVGGEAAIASMLMAAGASASLRQGARGQGDSPLRLALRGRDGGVRLALGIQMELACLEQSARVAANGATTRSRL